MENLLFRITSMPSTRPADYYLSYSGGSVFIDFNDFGNLIQLKRISFDGYGCCTLESAVPMNEEDSEIFKELFNNDLNDQELLKKLFLSFLLF